MKKTKTRVIKKLCTAGLIIASAFVGISTPLAVNMMHAEEVQAATGNEIVSYARRFKGYKYVYGGSGPNSFDCSGLVQYVFKHFGINLPHSSKEIYNNPTKYGTIVGYGSTANAKAGDLISWNGHVAIYSENGYCVEALNEYQGCGEWTVASHTNGSNYKVIRVGGVNEDTSKPLKGSPIGGGSQTISDGDYHIVSALNNSMGVDVAGNQNKDGTNVNLYSNINDDNQVFTVKYLGNGFYSICHRSSGKMLDVSGGSPDYGANTQIYGSNNTDAQKWVIKVSNETKYYYILSKCNGLCLDVESGNASNGTNIRMWGGNGSAAQKWKFVPVDTSPKPSQSTGRFSDVNKSAYYYNAVEWAAAKGIATGINGKFYPNSACSREEAITFLWRMQGKPAPKNMNSKFSDVNNKNRYSYNAIMWGTENGIITGSNGKFAPAATCTREQIITMLWRVSGKPDPRNMTSSFSDVKNTDSYSYKAVLWAKQNGIATGSNGIFNPAAKCKRCEIITFLYRYKN